MSADTERIAILLPVGDQLEEYLQEALASVLGQTSPDWTLLVGVDDLTPPALRGMLAAIDDDRVRLVERSGRGFALLLNEMMTEAREDFCCILLSDDRLTPKAVATLLRIRSRHPKADFFHSSRRRINGDGSSSITDPRPVSASVRPEDFRLAGSPVKHLMCWRRSMALEIGGMNVELSRHGCDDYDFPWRMCEAGARFYPVAECLYEYRVHDRGPRLTTEVPIQEQVDTLRRMFESHGVSRPETTAYVQQAMDTYLPWESTGRGRSTPLAPPHACFKEASAETLESFHGFAGRHRFPHRLYLLHRAGPDGAKLAERMCQTGDPARLRELLLFASPAQLADLPDELFFDDQLAWHGQHLGRPGLAAFANLVVEDTVLSVTQMLSDVVQRASRRRDYKTRIENRLKGWNHLLVNGILDYAMELGAPAVRFPTSARVLGCTDQTRSVDPALFERVYDRTVRERTSGHERDGWWWVDPLAQSDRMGPLEQRVEPLADVPVISIAHDIERGLGHIEADPAFAETCDGPARASLPRMLEAEARAGVEVTYNVVGKLWDDIVAPVRAGGHALGFHSYQHVVATEDGLWTKLQLRSGWGRRRAMRASTTSPEFMELVHCRDIDYRLRGYRPPQSRLSLGLHEQHLGYFNFEWLASSAYSLGLDDPVLELGVVKIPVHIDDYDLYRGRPYEEWERSVLERARSRRFTAISLHDCYADFWIDRYPELLAKLSDVGATRTFDEVADATLLASTRWI